MARLEFVAFRFLMKGTEKGRLSPMTVFAWIAIAVGVAAMSILLSVMYGFEGALRDRVLTAFPHVIVKSNSGTPELFDETITKKLKALAKELGLLDVVRFEGFMKVEDVAKFLMTAHLFVQASKTAASGDME